MFNPVDKTTFDVRKSSISVPTVFLVVWFLSDNHCFCQQRVINKWCMAFLILFEEGLRNLRDAQIVSRGTPDNWVPIGGDVVERNVARKTARERRKLEGLDLGMQELRTYFRLFMVSTFLLMFMFCTRISKNRNRDSGNVFDPWIPRKRWLELAAQLSFSWWPSVASDEQSVWNIWSWNTITQFCACHLELETRLLGSELYQAVPVQILVTARCRFG